MIKQVQRGTQTLSPMPLSSREREQCVHKTDETYTKYDIIVKRHEVVV